MTAGGSEFPTFSVIVPTYNRPRPLAACLTALAAMEYPRDRFEVIVVDDGGRYDPNPRIAQFARQMNVKLLRQPNAGPGAARNTGVASAAHEFLAFTDDDCMPHRQWLREFAAALSRDPEILAGGQCLNALPDNPYATASHSIIEVIQLRFNSDHEHAFFFPSDNMALKREKFLEIGGFDPAFRCSEDRDLCDRWAARGWRLVIVPQAVVDHAHEMGLSGFCRQNFGYGRGAWRFHRARARRGAQTFAVDSSFYLKCFQRPFAVFPLHRAILIDALLGIWQFTNALGFFYEAWNQKRSRIRPARCLEARAPVAASPQNPAAPLEAPARE